MNEITNTYLREISLLKESEDHIEFKEAKRDFNFNGGTRTDPKERRHCVLGYVVALANEKGGRLVFGMKDKHPHEVVGSSFALGETGALEDAIYDRHKAGMKRVLLSAKLRALTDVRVMTIGCEIRWLH